MRSAEGASSIFNRNERGADGPVRPQTGAQEEAEAGRRAGGWLHQDGPELLRYLALKLFDEGKKPAEIFTQTGWSKDIDNVWRYEYGDQKMKLREDNPNLDVPDTNYGMGKDPAGQALRDARHPDEG